MKKAIAVILCAAAAGGGFYYWKNSRPAPASMTGNVVDLSTQAPAQNIELGNELLREKADKIGAHAKLAEWLKNGDIIRRITAAAAIIAEGKSPRDSLGFLKPEKPFAAAKKKGKLYLDPKSYERHDLAADVVASLNAEATAKIFLELRPLFQQAYEELGESNRDFQATLLRAIDVLLQTPLLDGPIELRAKVASHLMVDPKLEKLSPAQKHLLRMGPKNAAKIQGKLREISLALANQGK